MQIKQQCAGPACLPLHTQNIRRHILPPKHSCHILRIKQITIYLLGLLVVLGLGGGRLVLAGHLGLVLGGLLGAGLGVVLLLLVGGLGRGIAGRGRGRRVLLGLGGLGGLVVGLLLVGGDLLGGGGDGLVLHLLGLVARCTGDKDREKGKLFLGGESLGPVNNKINGDLDPSTQKWSTTICGGPQRRRQPQRGQLRVQYSRPRRGRGRGRG